MHFRPVCFVSCVELLKYTGLHTVIDLAMFFSESGRHRHWENWCQKLSWQKKLVSFYVRVPKLLQLFTSVSCRAAPSSGEQIMSLDFRLLSFFHWTNWTYMSEFQILVWTDSLLASPLRTRLTSSLMWQLGETMDTSMGSPTASALETVVRKSLSKFPQALKILENLWIWQNCMYMFLL